MVVDKQIAFCTGNEAEIFQPARRASNTFHHDYLEVSRHWRQSSSPMQWVRQPLLWNPNILAVSGNMLGMEV